jgi:predicted PurR-regulated permease PerM
MKDTMQFPFYAKLTFVLLSLISIFTILYLGQNIIVPIVMALLFAILLRPIAHFLKEKWHFPLILAVTFTVIFFVLMVIGILYFISWQISDIAKDWGAIQTNLSIHFDSFQKFISSNFNINNVEQKVLINNASKNFLETGKNIIGTSLVSFSDIILNMTLIPIYIFIFLLYRTLFITFLSKLFQPAYHEKLQDILYQIKVSVQSYIVGLLIELVIVSTLTTVGFWRKICYSFRINYRDSKPHSLHWDIVCGNFKHYCYTNCFSRFNLNYRCINYCNCNSAH